LQAQFAQTQPYLNTLTKLALAAAGAVRSAYNPNKKRILDICIIEAGDFLKVVGSALQEEQTYPKTSSTYYWQPQQ
jgi:hypothetical protein